MKQNNDIKVGDKVVLANYVGSSIGHNGILCTVKMIDEKWGYYCESVNGSYHGWDKREHLVKQREYYARCFSLKKVG